MIESPSLSLATLAALTLLSVTGNTMTASGRILSSTISAAIAGLTARDGPWLFGCANRDYTDAEIEAYLENAGPVSPSDKVSREVASRGKNIRVLGVIEPRGNGTTASLFLKNIRMAGLEFNEDSSGIDWWIYNLGLQMTTGATLRIMAQHFVEFKE